METIAAISTIFMVFIVSFNFLASLINGNGYQEVSKAPLS